MTFNNATYSSVDSTVFEISPVTINFSFKALQTGKIVLNQIGPVRSVSKSYMSRKTKQTKTILPTSSTTVESNQDTSISLQNKILNISDTIVSDSNQNVKIDSITIKPIGERGNLITAPQNDWMIAIGLLVLILIAIVRFSFGKYLYRVLDSVLNYQSSNNLFLEKNMRNLRGSIFLNTLFFTNVSLFIVQYYNYFWDVKMDKVSFAFYLYSLIGLCILYLGKIIIIRSIGYIFNGSKDAKEYLHTIFIYNKNLAIILLPITLSVPFIAEYASSLLLNTGIIISLIFFLLRLFRGIKILFRKHVSIFYMILYLCALEILPLLVIYKLLLSVA